jgi:hypothetical protein
MKGRDRLVQVAIGFEEVDSNGMKTKRIVWVDCDAAQPVD